MISFSLTLLSLLFWIFICFCLSKRWHLTFSLLCTTIMIPMHYKNRPTIIRKIIDNFDEITSADAMRVGLWLLGEYCDSRDASVSERVYMYVRIMRECICGSCVSTALYSSMYPDFFIYPPSFPPACYVNTGCPDCWILKWLWKSPLFQWIEFESIIMNFLLWI